MSTIEDPPGDNGSWTPAIVATALLIARWLMFGQGDMAVKLRRYYGLQVSCTRVPNEERKTKSPNSSIGADYRNASSNTIVSSMMLSSHAT